MLKFTAFSCCSKYNSLPFRHSGNLWFELGHVLGCSPSAGLTTKVHTTLWLLVCIFNRQNCAKINKLGSQRGSCKLCQAQSPPHECNLAHTQSLPRSVWVLLHQPGCLQASGCFPSWSRLRPHRAEILRAPSQLTCLETTFFWPCTSGWWATLPALQNWLCCWLWNFSFLPLGCWHELGQVKSTIVGFENRCKFPRFWTLVEIQLRL